MGRPAGIEESLAFNARQDIFEPRVSVFVELRWIVYFHPGGNDDRPDLLPELLIRHVEVDAFLLAGINALRADGGIVPQAFSDIQNIGRRNRLGKRGVNGFSGGETLVELVGTNHGTNFGTLATSRAFLFFHISRPLADFHIEISDIAVYLNDFT